MASVPTIALLIETSREYGRGLLEGVAQYHREFGPWSIDFVPHGLNEPPPAWLLDWQGDGILARIDDRRMADSLQATGLPVVDVRGALDDLPFPFVGLDNRPIARMGFEHLKECGLLQFTFCGMPPGENPNQDLRCRYFVESVEQFGAKCNVFVSESGPHGRRTWDEDQTEIARWLTTLPKPVGIMTCHDDRGHDVLNACQRVGLRVPDEVAVVGVDNDHYLCSMCTPELSSVDTSASQEKLPGKGHGGRRESAARSHRPESSNRRGV